MTYRLAESRANFTVQFRAREREIHFARLSMQISPRLRDRPDDISEINAARKKVDIFREFFFRQTKVHFEKKKIREKREKESSDSCVKYLEQRKKILLFSANE